MEITYEKLKAISDKLSKNSRPLSELVIWPLPERIEPEILPANTRVLVSRNKREGWYYGKKFKMRDRIDNWDAPRRDCRIDRASYRLHRPSASQDHRRVWNHRALPIHHLAKHRKVMPKPRRL